MRWAWVQVLGLVINSASAAEERPWVRHVIDDGLAGADGVRLADVNGDGRPDVATGWEEGGTIRVCLHPGMEKVKEKWPGVSVGKVGSPEDAVFVDLDGDGDVDVVSSCEGKIRSIFFHFAPGRQKILDA
ncbi:MAG TPA: FG-GAP-like repeat-containing protein, partial [Tepidisphaeraceae bacterium]|nr:FG-GAP-like repeat-containing protein [Tepidisphaeraceae bacterium]